VRFLRRSNSREGKGRRGGEPLTGSVREWKKQLETSRERRSCESISWEEGEGINTIHSIKWEGFFRKRGNLSSPTFRGEVKNLPLVVWGKREGFL